MTGKLRVWWIPQVPMEPFYVDVENVDEAKKILTVLAKYDLFQFKNNVKPDYTNAGGLQEQDAATQEWFEYSDMNGDSIDEIMNPMGDEEEPC